jgi:hypothetical protein
MESILQLKDLLDFDELYNKFKMEILEKHGETKPLGEDLA